MVYELWTKVNFKKKDDKSNEQADASFHIVFAIEEKFKGVKKSEWAK